MSLKKQDITCRRSRGFTLIEVLVSMVILAIGLLGLAGLQTTGIRFNQSALLRSQATLCAYDMADRMRANKASAIAGDYARSFGDTKPTQTCTSATSNCSGSQMAQADIKDWLESLQGLPSGDGAISVTSSGIATIIVHWNDTRDTSGNSSNLTSFTITTQL